MRFEWGEILFLIDRQSLLVMAIFILAIKKIIVFKRISFKNIGELFKNLG